MVMLQPGTHTGTDSNGSFVKLKDWSGANDSNVTFWKSGGDIQLWGFAKQDDGSWTASGGREYVSGAGWQPLIDRNGDGVAFKVSTQNADGSFSYWADASRYRAPTEGKLT
jgi:hypothetical protein